MLNTLKYKQLAAGGQGIRPYEDSISEHWSEWLQIVQSSKLYAKYTSLGYRGTLESCARDIYIMGVWFFGLLRQAPASAEFYKSCIEYYHQLGMAKNYRYNSSSVYYPLTCIGGLPSELYLMDNWLEGIRKSSTRST
jgi:hypothetical protein